MIGGGGVLALNFKYLTKNNWILGS